MSYHDDGNRALAVVGLVFMGVLLLGVGLGWFLRGEPQHNETCADLRCVGDGGWQRVCVENPGTGR